jgi:hypothetical protein
MKLLSTFAAALAAVLTMIAAPAVARAGCASSIIALNRVDSDEAALASYAQAHHGHMSAAPYHNLTRDLAASAGTTKRCDDVHARDAYSVADLTRWYAGAGAGMEPLPTAAHHMRADLVDLQRQGYETEDADAFDLYVGEAMQVYDFAGIAWQPLPRHAPLTALSPNS